MHRQAPDFVEGYAVLLEPAVGYAGSHPDAEPLYNIENGIFYVNDRSAADGCDRLEACFGCEGDELTAWIDAACLRPLAEEEVLGFVSERIACEDTCYHNGNMNLPLDAPAISLAVTFSLLSRAEETPVLSVEPGSLVLGVSESRELLSSYSDGQVYPLNYASDNSDIASVSQNGKVTGKKRGSTKLHISDEFGNAVTVDVVVKKAPTQVKIALDRKTLGVGDKLILPIHLSSGAASLIRYEIDNADILAVDAATGEITALAEGEAKLTVKTYNNKAAACTIKVVAAPETITITNPLEAMGIDQTYKLAVSLNEGSAGAYSFESDQPEIVTVDPVTGEMAAVALGSATIRVVAYNKVEALLSITVKSAPSCVSFAKETVKIGVNEKIAMPEVTLGVEGEDCAGSYSFKSSNPRCVSMTSTGRIRGVRAGSATITVTTHNGVKDTLTVRVYNAPGSISVSPKKDTLGVGERLQLKHSLPKNTMSGVSYESSAPEIAEVDAVTGEVIARAEGQAVITVKTFNGNKASSTITVASAPDRVWFEQGSQTVGTNETVTLKACVPEGSSSKFTFASSDSSIVSVEPASGKIKSLAPGKAVITVSTYNKHEASCELTVKAAPTSITLHETSITLSVGDTFQLQEPVLGGEDVGCNKIGYSSSNSRYASVNGSGLIKGVRAGSVTITAKTYNNKKDTLKVTIKDAPKSISFEQSAVTMFMCDVLSPKVVFSNKATGNYTLVSSNPQVAAIAEDGRSVLPVAGGKAEITATSYNGKTATMNLTVLAMPDSIRLQPASFILGVGDSQALQPVMPEGQGSPLIYTSSNTDVATVDEQGKVTAVAPGSATITVETFNKKSNTSTVTVMAAPSRVQLTPRYAARSIDEGGMQLQLNFGSDAEGGRYSYSSSNTAVATVSSDGMVSFVSTGTVQIRVATYNGRSAVCDLTIGETPTQISFAQDVYKVALGDRITIPAVFDKGCESYDLTVENADIASTSGDQVRGRAVGSTTLTARSRSGLTASCTLEVVPAPTGVALEQEAVEIKLGLNPTVQLSASVLPDGVGSVYFLSSNPDVAAVDYVTGVVEGKVPGECVITARTYDGQHEAQCKVTVRLLLHGVKIGIDPGHQRYQNLSKEKSSPKGGTYKAKVSSGASGRATRIPEYVTNLQVGLKLKKALEALGAEVYMTRETHYVNISNQQRAKMMNRLGVDLVLRLHCNSSSSSSTQGLSLYIRSTCAYANSVVNGSKLLANERRLANAIFAEYPKITGCKRRKITRNNDYTGNNWSTVPCVLVEMGYNSNRAEDRLLNTPSYQNKIVKGLINGICVYKGLDKPY